MVDVNLVVRGPRALTTRLTTGPGRAFGAKPVGLPSLPRPPHLPLPWCVRVAAERAYHRVLHGLTRANTNIINYTRTTHAFI